MAGISAPGLGSGLDVNGIISQLMAVERQPLTKLDQKEAVYQAQISGYGSLKSALSSLRSSLDKLQESDLFHATRGNSSDEDVLVASSDPGAVPSIYDVTVDRMAQRHKAGSSEFASDATFGGGAGDQLQIMIGASSFSIDLSAGMTLQEIQAAINADDNGTGITAGLITGDSGRQTLVLTSPKSGYDDRIQFSFGGGIDASTFGFTTLNRDASGQPLADDTELDASLTVDGVSVTRGTNSIDDVIEGLSLELKGTGHAVASIDDDPGAVTAAVNGFIKAYNEMKDQLATLSEGTLNGSSLLRTVESQVRGVVNRSLNGLGDIGYLSQLGITSDEKTGKLSLDGSMLNDALDQHRDGVAAFFSDSDRGFAISFDTMLDGFLKSGGMIDSAIDGTNSRIDQIGGRRESLERRLESIERRYQNQFTALDTLVAQMNTTSNYLTGQLESLANMLKNK
ncbi:MAG TPA: hypothetical protein ENI96_14730 [Sedimenticola thiotaurini]|uniref:Flagellar hook-associated protein 2 n=1 Tax=Sedimenticola thiotaurini TaxID=1543721 RepID=A0A831RND4_9GAMM|nr:hypothetical protein [Sedimenticola thiotaurini]